MRCGHQILTTGHPDFERWQELVDRCPRSDIFFTPQYAMLFEQTEGETREDFGGQARLFLYGDNDNYIVYPFFERKIGELTFARLLPPESSGWSDIISPYGYSGPLANINDSEVATELWRGFMEEFHGYCLSHNIVSEFARLNPFVENHLPLREVTGGAVRLLSQIVYVALKQDQNFIDRGLSRGNRSSIAKARHGGVSIVRSKTADDMETFYRLYTSTMERNSARKSYFFSPDFFSRLAELLGENVELFTAHYGGRAVAAALFLLKSDIVHYYLGASDTEFLHVRPNNLLFYEAICWAKEAGYAVFNMGGGHGMKDSLFQFKSSFSKTTADFYTYTKIHNEKGYEVLCRSREDFDKRAGENAVPMGYFPGYRR